MNILVLGGTKFVGRAIVERLVTNGHQVTLFTRGQTNADAFPDLPHLVGDRLGDVSALDNAIWDVVVDVSAYVPRAVDNVAHHLVRSNPYYLFISTISVYDDPPAGTGEAGNLLGLEDPTTEVVNGETYGGLKVLCEKAVESHFPQHAIVRPGLIVGPHDPTDRFTYWVWRIGQGGRVPVPDVPDFPLQVIDVRDLASFVVGLVESKAEGVFNAVGADITVGEMFQTISSTVPGSAELVTLPKEKFIENGVEAWKHLPMVAAFDGSGHGMMRVSASKAETNGLSRRPLTDTVRDTFEFFKDRESMVVGMSSEQEAALLG
ncbi:MAG TPA: NAD-dependent epimerase/dehydratase family protein [Fimbriimonadaceae bacterium]|nr:NAD-dependent epimerase/dehydratase family protein [Fimbriimonadaceae bacterium]